MRLLPEIAEQTSAELTTLPAIELQQLQEQLTHFSKQLMVCKERLAEALSLKYAVRLSAVRQSQAKATGTVLFDDEGVSVFADIHNTIEWDQKKLAHIAKKLILADEDPAEFITITYHVPESVYRAWPDVLRDQFSSARTIRSQQETVQLRNTTEVAA